MTVSRLELAALHRPGHAFRGGSVTERWSWDFVVDGVALSTRVGGDVAGALGWGDAAWESRVADKLLGRAAPDLPPDRVALYICPECGDLACGAVTASLGRKGDVVTWRDFAWERDWEDVVEDRRLLALRPLHFDRGAYGRLLRGGRHPAGARDAPRGRWLTRRCSRRALTKHHVRRRSAASRLGGVLPVRLRVRS